VGDDLQLDMARLEMLVVAVERGMPFGQAGRNLLATILHRIAEATGDKVVRYAAKILAGPASKGPLTIDDSAELAEISGMIARGVKRPAAMRMMRRKHRFDDSTMRRLRGKLSKCGPPL